MSLRRFGVILKSGVVAVNLSLGYHGHNLFVDTRLLEVIV